MSNNPLALITGAGSGIGRAASLRFAAEGTRVLALDRNEQSLGELSKTPGITPCVFDLGNLEELPAFVKHLSDEHGPITSLINNAGAWHYEPLSGIQLDRWEHIFRINVTSPFLLIRELAPRMVEHGQGTIVNIASRNALVSSKGSAAYDASKAALVALTRTAAGEFAPQVNINAICPGVIDTPANQDLFDNAEASANYLRLIPAGRYGTSEEIAGITWFLTTTDARFITGQTLVADGG
ncbi:MAG: SDR family NAD(P)-dependent oxidoreductase, partial [bacterium]|nr:SDR family NAD(P)-dependent oxidoreductase [bacterium]